MTPQGVMVTAFGLGSTGSPSSNVFYLDMRDSTQSTWTWKSSWNKDMLETYQSSSTSPTANIAAAEPDSGDKKKVTSIVVPVIIAMLILVPLAIWFVRRRVRLAKKRRMARHFSFSSQEDEGDFRTAIDSFHSPSRRTRTQYGFGQDANEKDGNIFTDLAGVFKRLSARRTSTESSESSISAGEREMIQVDSPPRVRRLDEKAVRWENIDFGLGKLDERAQGESKGLGVASTLDPFADPAPLIRFDSADSESPRMGTPLHDGQQPLVPELNVFPPSAPATPAALGPAFQPSSSDGLDWSMLAKEMQMKPAFRSISPTSTLRSHSHAQVSPITSPIYSVSPMPRSVSPSPVSPMPRSVSPSPVSPVRAGALDTDGAYDGYAPAPGNARPLPAFPQSSGPIPRLPSLDFQRQTVSLVDPSLRRASDTPLPYTPRTVSQPLAGRQLAGNNRRGSMPYSPSSSGSATPTARSPQLGVQTQVRRASNPAVIPLPRSPRSPGSPGTFGQNGSVNGKEKRDSGMSRLRVMNMTEDDETSVETSRE